MVNWPRTIFFVCLVLFQLHVSFPSLASDSNNDSAMQDMATADFEKIMEQLRQHLEQEEYEPLITLANQSLRNSELTLAQLVSLSEIELQALLNYQNKQGAFVIEAYGYLKTRVETFLPELDDPIQQASFAHNLSKFDLVQGNYAETYRLNQMALTYLTGTKNALLADIYYYLGAAQARQGELSNAVESMLKGLQTNEELGLPYSVRQLVGLGVLYNLLGDMENSVEWLEKALVVAEPDSSSMMKIKMNLASSLIELKRIEEGIRYMEDSIRISEKLGRNNYGAINNLGYTYMLIGEYDKALIYLNRARHYYQQNQIMPVYAMTLKNIGEVHTHLDEREKSAEYFAEALDIYHQHESIKPHLELYPVMIENLTILGRFEEALALMHEFKDLADKITNLDSQKHINELTTRFEVELKQKELDRLALEQKLQNESILALEKEKQNDKKINQLLYVVAACLIIALCILLALLRYRSNANTLLQQKNTDIVALNEQLTELTRIDTLTGLYNRRYLTEFVEREMANIVRRSWDNQKPEWLLIALDIDHFKSFNDKYGHTAGDRALVNFAQQLSACARESDFTIRWGGEEFLWLCKHTDLTQARVLYQRLQEKLADNPIQIDGQQLPISCSAGIVSFPVSNASKNAWQITIELADRSLYKAKEYGRAQWVGYIANDDTPDNIALEDIPALIEQGKFTEVKA